MTTKISHKHPAAIQTNKHTPATNKGTAKHLAPVANNNGNNAGKIKDCFDTKPQAQRPATTVGEYRRRLTQMTPAQLDAHEKFLKERLADASSGSDKNSGIMERVQGKLEALKTERATREKLADSKTPAFDKLIHSGSDKALHGEIAKQQERLKEATTGVDTDPAAAADAKKKLSRLNEELKTRTTADATPLEKNSKTEALGTEDMRKLQEDLRSKSPAELEKLKDRAQADLKDASSGARKDPVAVRNALNTLKQIEAELDWSKKIENSSMPKFAANLHTLDEGALKLELDKAKERFNEASTGASTSPSAAAEAQRQLALIRAEMAYRADQQHSSIVVPTSGPAMAPPHIV